MSVLKHYQVGQHEHLTFSSLPTRQQVYVTLNLAADVQFVLGVRTSSHATTSVSFVIIVKLKSVFYKLQILKSIHISSPHIQMKQCALKIVSFKIA